MRTKWLDLTMWATLVAGCTVKWSGGPLVAYAPLFAVCVFTGGLLIWREFKVMCECAG